MDIHCNGFHYGSVLIGGLRSAMAHHRQIHQDGTFHTSLQGPAETGTPGENIHQGNLEIPWHPNRHYLRLRLQIHINRMETIPGNTRNQTKDEHLFPPTNGWSNQMNYPNNQGISQVIHELRNG
jgi:hypothetical protein